MLFYTTPRAPNPRRVAIFLAEKGVEIETCVVNLIALEHHAESFTKVNPLRAVPALQLDDGAVLTESVAICRYIEGLYPEPPLFGRGAREEAFVEMWQRRAEFGLFLPIAGAFRHSHPRMAALEQPQIALLAETLRVRAQRFMAFLDKELSTRRFLSGDAFTIADITAHVALELAPLGRVVIPEGLSNLSRWRAELATRPSMAPEKSAS